jgi:hypothetical protein
MIVQIANPIYDSVFKYLMNDEKVAKLLLSAIIGREVVELEFRPTEHHFPFREVLTVLRMDFQARIIDEDGNQELVLIELQKAKLASDIMRFRKYLGAQYADPGNVVRESESEYPPRKALPILSIYFLGHTLDRVKAPVVRVNRHYTDAATGEVIPEREEFIESLTHDSIVIQIPYLEGRRRNELELLLALFDQSNQAADHHFLNIEEEELPERYRPLLRRLQKVAADPVIRQTMDAEDDLIEEFRDLQRLIARKEQQVEVRDKVIQGMEQDMESKDQMIQSKDEIIKGAIKSMFKAGTRVEELAGLFRMTVGEVEKILER